MSRGSPGGLTDLLNTILEAGVSTSIFTRIGGIVSPTFAESIVSWQVVSNLAVGAVCLAISRWLFERFTVNEGVPSKFLATTSYPHVLKQTAPGDIFVGERGVVCGHQ